MSSGERGNGALLKRHTVLHQILVEGEILVAVVDIVKKPVLAFFVETQLGTQKLEFLLLDRGQLVHESFDLEDGIFRVAGLFEVAAHAFKIPRAWPGLKLGYLRY